MPSVDNYRLRPFTEAELSTVLSWRNTERIRANMYTDHIITPEEHRTWFSRIDGDNLSRYDIFECGNRPVGLSCFTEIDRTHGTCTWGFYLGETDLPPGSGTVMGYLAMNLVFAEEGLRKVSGEVLDFNKASRKYFQRLGFTEEGCRRQHILRNGEYVDVVLFSLLVDEWNERQQSKVRELVSLREVNR